MTNADNSRFGFAMVSLGCAKNQVDAETMAGLLDEAGYAACADPRDAQVIIVNTCGFIQSAKEESIEAILDMAEHKKNAACRALIVTGCLSQRYGNDMLSDMPEVDAFVGIGHIGGITGIVERALSGERFVTGEAPYAFVEAKRALSTSPGYAYLKVADGCDNRCSYCAIPGIRGGYVSRPMQDVIKEAKSLAESGFREIIPIAQDTSRYGSDLYGRPRIVELLEELNAIPGIKWIRPMYFYPDAVTRELIDAMAALPKVCNYIDLPVQHIDDAILAAMNRRGGSKLIKSVLSYARSKGEFALRTTLIAGFPGETKEQFGALLSFMREYPFDRLGAFAYSREEGTAAAGMDAQIKSALKSSRRNRIMAAQREISKGLLSARVGREYEVVIESMGADGRYVGRSMLEAPEVDGCVYVSGDGVEIGRYVNVRITGAFDYDLTGVPL